MACAPLTHSHEGGWVREGDGRTGGVVKYIQQKQQQKQQRQQHKNLLWQFIQLNIPMLRDVKPLNIPPKVHARLIPLSS